MRARRAPVHPRRRGRRRIIEHGAAPRRQRKILPPHGALRHIEEMLHRPQQQAIKIVHLRMVGADMADHPRTGKATGEGSEIGPQKLARMDDAHPPPPEIRPHGKAGCKIGPGPAQAHLGLGETGGFKPVIPAESLKLCGRVAFRQIQHVPIAERRAASARRRVASSVPARFVQGMMWAMRGADMPSYKRPRTRMRPAPEHLGVIFPPRAGLCSDVSAISGETDPCAAPSPCCVLCRSERRPAT